MIRNLYPWCYPDIIEILINNRVRLNLKHIAIISRDAKSRLFKLLCIRVQSTNYVITGTTVLLAELAKTSTTKCHSFRKINSIFTNILISLCICLIIEWKSTAVRSFRLQIIDWFKKIIHLQDICRFFKRSISFDGVSFKSNDV